MKRDDKITMREGALSRFGKEVGGRSGIVLSPGHLYEAPFTAYVHLMGLEGGRLVRPEDILPNEDEKIDAALKETKRVLELCGDFDEAVSRAKNMPLVDRLRYVADSMGKEYVFDYFNSILNEPASGVKVGQWITGVDSKGQKFSFEVSGVEYNRNPKHAAVYGSYWFVEGENHSVVVYVDGEPRKTLSARTDRDNWANWTNDYAVTDKKPMELPEVGRWIAATDVEGTTKVIKVRDHNRYGNTTLLSAWGPNGNARIEHVGEVVVKEGTLVEWEYV